VTISPDPCLLRKIFSNSYPCETTGYFTNREMSNTTIATKTLQKIEKRDF